MYNFQCENTHTHVFGGLLVLFFREIDFGSVCLTIKVDAKSCLTNVDTAKKSNFKLEQLLFFAFHKFKPFLWFESFAFIYNKTITRLLPITGRFFLWVFLQFPISKHLKFKNHTCLYEKWKEYNNLAEECKNVI